MAIQEMPVEPPVQLRVKEVIAMLDGQTARVIIQSTWDLLEVPMTDKKEEDAAQEAITT